MYNTKFIQSPKLLNMPAITRNMKKNAQNVNSDNIPKVNLLKDVVPIRQCARKVLDPQFSRLPNQFVIMNGPQRTPEELAFINEMKGLLTQCEAVQGKKNKMEIAIKIYKNVNYKLAAFLAQNPYTWNRFAATVYIKAIEFENQYKNNDWINDVNPELIYEFNSELNKSINYLENYLISLKINPFALHYEPGFSHFHKALELIEKRKLEQANSRPRRNIQRVNYIGMDMNSDDEGTISISKTKWNNGKPTHYWVKYQASQANEIGDEDFFESEDEEPEDEEPEDEPEKRYRKDIESYENEDAMEYEQRLKAVIKRRLSQMESKSRPRRNVQRVNYTGMDMNSDDEGEVSVCKTKWNNGVPSYSWVKYPAAQANEIGDEDYSFDI